MLRKNFKLGTHGSPRRRGSGHEPPVKHLGLGEVKRFIAAMHNADTLPESIGDHHLVQLNVAVASANRTATPQQMVHHTNVSTSHPATHPPAPPLPLPPPPPTATAINSHPPAAAPASHNTASTMVATAAAVVAVNTTMNNNSNSNGNGNSNSNCNNSNSLITSSSVSSAPNHISATNGPRECAGCEKRITERFLLKALDLFWHEDCLKCGCCDCRLGEVGSTLYTKANLILCKRDYLRLFGATGYCAACNKVIPAFEMVMRAKSNVYHLECFACQQCNHRFCVGDRFYLCDNKILCEYDYEERLVFANMAYNPSSLAHIRRQVSNLQPAGDNLSCPNSVGGRMSTQQLNHLQQQQQHNQQQQQQQQQQQHNQQQQQPQKQLPPPSCFGGEKLQLPVPPPSNMGPHRDDGSSGYGSPDSETFETPQAQ